MLNWRLSFLHLLGGPNKNSHLLLHLVVRDEDGGSEGESDCEGQDEAGVGDGEVGAPQQTWAQPSVILLMN